MKNNQNAPRTPRVCDYEGSNYRTDFWDGQGREYEDLAERAALRKILPRRGARLIEIGAGFGRLADLYAGYDQIVLLDYARSGLQEARARWGDEKFIYVAANLYDMPFVASAFDTVVTVRVLHHVQDLAGAFAEFARVLAPRGKYVLEYANKRHLKAILRYALRLQEDNPFSLEPLEFVELNFDFHPRYVEERLRGAGFDLHTRLAVSSFRWNLFKRAISPRILAALDDKLQRLTAPLNLSPSIFVDARPTKNNPKFAETRLFRCLECGGDAVRRDDGVECAVCGAFWRRVDGIYDFKAQ